MSQPQHQQHPLTSSEAASGSPYERDRLLAASLLREWQRGFGRSSGAGKARDDGAYFLRALDRALREMAEGRCCPRRTEP